MGGYVLLGYEANDRTLTIVESEAETVRALFRLYLELGSVRRVKEEADRLGFRSKPRRAAGEGIRGGADLSLCRPRRPARFPCARHRGEHPRGNAARRPHSSEADQGDRSAFGLGRAAGTAGVRMTARRETQECRRGRVDYRRRQRREGPARSISATMSENGGAGRIRTFSTLQRIRSDAQPNHGRIVSAR